MIYLILIIQIIILWRQEKMANTVTDVLREVGETVTSNNDLLTSVTALLNQASQSGEKLTQEQIDSIVGQLQSVQDANSQVKTAIDAALAVSTNAGEGTTGEGAEA